MAFKTLLSVATQAATLRPVLETAGRLALANDAHLDVLSLGLDRTQIGYYSMAGTINTMQIAIEAAERDSEEIDAAARTLLANQSPTLRWSTEPAVAAIGNLTGLVALRARFADLVVLGAPYGDKQGVDAEAVLEAALFEGQAPALVLPPDFAPETAIGKTVVVGWNQSREALTAVRRAMPFLHRADKVKIAVIEPPLHGPERSDPGRLLCQMLVRHGVKAEVSVLAKTLPKVSDVLVRQCQDQNADLLVMGAYSHSRFREAILGGATRAMLEKAHLPVLLAH